MIEIEEIITLIHDASVDGHLGDSKDVQVWLNTMSKLDKEILLLVANEYKDIGFGEGYADACEEL